MSVKLPCGTARVCRTRPEEFVGFTETVMIRCQDAERMAMFRLLFAATLACGGLFFVAPYAAAWGPDGHSIVAEIAQRRLSPAARAEVEALLGPGHTLASEGSWADDVRDARPETANWHFVDIPVASESYDPARDCAPTPKGDCVVAELARVKQTLACGNVEARREALRFAVHFVGDIHQPLHTVGDERGGNAITVTLEVHGLRCPTCAVKSTPDNLHAAWDGSLISATVWSWGAYVARLESGWLASSEARDVALATPTDWANETHAVARDVWAWLPADHVIRDDYYAKAVPVIDRQLGRAGLRLAGFLDQALARGACTN
jgi:hypothetical protein